MTRPHTSSLSPHPPWQVIGWSYGLISLPGGPIEVISGWTIGPEGDVARGSGASLVVPEHSPFVRTNAPTELARYRITGTVHSRTRNNAVMVAREEMTRIIAVISTALNTSLAAVTDVWVESAVRAVPKRQFGMDVGLQVATIQPLDEAAQARIREFWRSLGEFRERGTSYVVERAAGWYRKALFDFDTHNRILFCWTALDALTAAVPRDGPRAGKQCPNCKAEMRCAHCSYTEPGQGGEKTISLRDLLIDQYHVMGKRDFEQMRKVRNQLVHGSVDPAEVSTADMEQVAGKMLEATSKVISAVLADRQLKVPTGE